MELSIHHSGWYRTYRFMKISKYRWKFNTISAYMPSKHITSHVEERKKRKNIRPIIPILYHLHSYFPNPKIRICQLNIKIDMKCQLIIEDIIFVWLFCQYFFYCNWLVNFDLLFHWSKFIIWKLLWPFTWLIEKLTLLLQFISIQNILFIIFTKLTFGFDSFLISFNYLKPTNLLEISS